MTLMPLAKLEFIDPRLVWSDEPGYFTPWLADNLDLLGEEIGLELEFVDKEVQIGGLWLDIAAQTTNLDDSEQPTKVVIENQLTGTDHDHLGKLLTYAGGRDAKIVVWVATGFKDEHIEALDWLNRWTDESIQFYGVTISVRRIGDSQCAPEFRAVAFPTTPPNSSAIPKVSEELSARQQQYRAFFQELIDELRVEHRFTQARVPSRDNFYFFSSGYAGIQYGATLGWGSTVIADVYLSHRDQEVNKTRFDALKERAEEIETSLGQPLEWRRMDDQKFSRIVLSSEGSIDNPPETLATIREWLIENLLKLKTAFDPFLTEVSR